MDNIAFVQKVKMLCLEKDLKPSNVCAECGLGSSFLPDIKRGRVPSVDKVERLAAYLGVTTSELLGEEKKPTPVSEGEPISPPGYHLLSPANKAIVDQLSASLLESQQSTPVLKVIAAASDGSRPEAAIELDPEFKLPQSVQALPDEYKGKTGDKASAPEEK